MAPYQMTTQYRSDSRGASRKCFHYQNWLLLHAQRDWCRFKHFQKPSVLHVEARRLEKIFGPSRALIPKFEQEFKVLIRMGEPDSEGKVGVFIIGKRRHRKRAKSLLRILAARPGRKLCGDLMMLSIKKSVKRENADSDATLSTAMMTSLDEAMKSLEIGGETVQEPVTKTV
ncbi:oocyte-expressed protein homolog [Suricata suricatta]|uniref:oocyte-expressed protein homolog n=1 Tax=Suricata suricatta TaxID=37032 RepID=UPI001155B5AD|nr:oocyte-expressed protein homolog [Suricata suricatta]